MDIFRSGALSLICGGSLRDNKVKNVDIVLTCKQPGVDAGIKLPDAGPKCPAGSSPCSSSSQCAAKMKCFSGCCTRIIQ